MLRVDDDDDVKMRLNEADALREDVADNECETECDKDGDAEGVFVAVSELDADADCESESVRFERVCDKVIEMVLLERDEEVVKVCEKV